MKVTHPITNAKTDFAAHEHKYYDEGDKLVFCSRFAIASERREEFLEKLEKLKKTLAGYQDDHWKHFLEKHPDLESRVTISHSVEPELSERKHPDGSFFLLLFSTQVGMKGLSPVQARHIFYILRRYHFLARNQEVKKFVDGFNAVFKRKHLPKEKETRTNFLRNLFKRKS